MSCNKCNFNFDDTNHQGYLLNDCKHEICSDCLNKFDDEFKCPQCNDQIVSKNEIDLTKINNQVSSFKTFNI